MEEFIGEFFSLGTRKKCLCPMTFDTADFDLAIFEMQQDIMLATRLNREIQRFHDEVLRAKTVQSAWLKSLTNAENLKSEISIRFKSISKKLDVKLEDLGDYQVLELSQDKTVDMEKKNLQLRILPISGTGRK